MDKLLAWMDENGFYVAPCSGGNHLAKEGGLAKHSLNVLGVMQDMSFLLCNGPENISKEYQDAIYICSLLHDLGKCGDYGKPGYVPNMLKGRATKANPAPEPYQSPSKPFKVNDGLSPVDHEVRSVKIASKFNFRYFGTMDCMVILDIKYKERKRHFICCSILRICGRAGLLKKRKKNRRLNEYADCRL